MKVTLKYEETDDKAFHMTLRLTLTQKYISGETKGVVKLFVDHYNKKHAESGHTLDAEELHLKIVGGDHLERDAEVSDKLKGGNECYLMGKDTFIQPVKPAPPAPLAYSTTTSSSSAPAAGYGSAKKDEQGRLRCKRFGCQKFYDPNGPPQECVHHKAAPIFHETAKWWSCCQDKKAYDFEEFMGIPGCQTSTCSNTPDGGQQKTFLGGHDIRAASAPVRLDADAPVDPRFKLAALRKGCVAMGVDGDLFDKVCQQLAVQTNGDFDAVCGKLRTRFVGILNAAGA